MSSAVEDDRIVEFARRWLPYGGGSPGDLLVEFGMTPAGYLTRLGEILDSPAAIRLHPPTARGPAQLRRCAHRRLARRRISADPEGRCSERSPVRPAVSPGEQGARAAPTRIRRRGDGGSSERDLHRRISPDHTNFDTVSEPVRLGRQHGTEALTQAGDLGTDGNDVVPVAEQGLAQRRGIDTGRPGTCQYPQNLRVPR